MKLAVFCWEFPPRMVGGLGTYASEILPRFVKMGTDVTLFTLNDGNLKTREVLRGVEVHRPRLVEMQDTFPSTVTNDIPRLDFFSNIFTYNILSSAKLVNKLVRIEGKDFDCIISHDWLSIIGGMVARNELNRKMIFHLHSTEKGRSRGNGSRIIDELEHMGGEKADTVVTVSYAMKNELISSGFPREKIHVIYNGVDPDKYDPEKVSEEKKQEIRSRYGVNLNDPMLLFVGRIVASKGVDKLVQSMPYVLKKFPKAKLVIVGTSDLQFFIQELINSQHLQENVKMRLEFISEEERVAHYAACDVCVLPSLYEPFGIAALEAMSMQKPVVVGANGTSGMREFVVPDGEAQTGIHIDPNDPADIAWGIMNVLEDQVRAYKMGLNGRRTVLESFTWDQVTAETIRLYEDVINTS